MEDITFERMQENQVRQVAHIHAEALPEDLLPQLGKWFLEKGYYRSLVDSPYSLVIVAKKHSQILGFVNLSFDPGKHIARMIKTKMLRLLVAMVRVSCVSPLRIVEIFSAVARANAEVPENSAEIAFIAVKPDFQGQGIGKQLVEQANTLSKEQGIQYLFTKTLKSNVHVQWMYQKYWNARIMKEIRILNKNYVYLLWQVREDDSVTLR